MHLRFVASESAFDYFRSTRAYIEAHGKPVAFYSDKHSVFRVNNKDVVGGDGMTQFSRALSELNIDIICANSPQAKACVSYYTSFAWLMVIGIKRVEPPRPGLPWAIVQPAGISQRAEMRLLA